MTVKLTPASQREKRLRVEEKGEVQKHRHRQTRLPAIFLILSTLLDFLVASHIKVKTTMFSSVKFH